MRWIQNLKNRGLIVLIALSLSPMSFGQLGLEISYDPGFASVQPGFNANLVFTNAGINTLFKFQDSDVTFLSGIHFINRGNGARVGVYDQNGSFVRFQRTSENLYYVHIPIGIRITHQDFFGDLGLGLDRFLYYREKTAGVVTSDIPPSWVSNTLIGLNLAIGKLFPLNNDHMVKVGAYFNNNFGGGSVTNNFFNFGLSLGYHFGFSEEYVEDSEELDEYLE